MKRFRVILLLCSALALGAPAVFATGAGQSQGIASRIDSETASVSTASDGITLGVSGEKSEKFYIYSITGQLVKAVEIGGGGSEKIELPRGCYIVKCAQWSKKVMVR